MAHGQSLPRQLYELRRRIGIARQPECDPGVGELHIDIAEDPYHPYGHFDAEPEGWRAASDRIYGKLLGHPCFSSCTVEKAVRVKATHLFRITTLDAIVRDVDSRHLQLQTASSEGSPFSPSKEKHEAYAELQGATNGTWAPLDDFVTGTLQNTRTATWWTCQSVDPSNVYGARLRIGMWPELIRPVILRLDLASLERSLQLDARPPIPILLPLETDAFAYPVFDAQPTDLNPSSGKAIDLSRFPKPLKPGWPEYVLHRVPVSAIEIAACEHPKDPDEARVEQRKMINDRSPEFWNALIKYHRSKRRR